jgi:SAM-dependent methyltransferase
VLRQRISGALEAIGLLPLSSAAYLELTYLRQLPGRARAASPDPFPLPPPRLIFRVARTPSEAWYVESGARAAESLSLAVARAGSSVAACAAVLDFGCGCGRVARRWYGTGLDLHGTDVNAEAVAWCRDNLPFATFTRNEPEPPLAYPDGRFGLVYALSVLTHLPEELGLAWRDELVRVLAPEGLLVLSLHGERYRERLTSRERTVFDEGRLVVRRPRIAGSNLCTAFHPAAYVRDVLAGPLSLVEHAPGGATGNPQQDLVVLRRPAGQPAPESSATSGAVSSGS